MKLLKWLAITPLIVIGLAFAVANRHLATVSFDPFAGNDVSSPQITVPLFFLLFVALVFGVVLGGVATWISQGKNRKAARLAKAEAEQWRSEADRLRAQIPALSPSPASSRALVRSY